MRIFMRQLLSYGGLNQKPSAEPGLNKLRRGPGGVAEFDQPVKPRYDAACQGKGTVGFGRLNIQIHLGIDEERRAPAHFISQKRSSCPSMIERLDHDVFQFVPQELLDGALVFFLYLSVIGE